MFLRPSGITPENYATCTAKQLLTTMPECFSVSNMYSKAAVDYYAGMFLREQPLQQATVDHSAQNIWGGEPLHRAAVDYSVKCFAVSNLYSKQVSSALPIFLDPVGFHSCGGY